jgi:hypothetical protein
MMQWWHRQPILLKGMYVGAGVSILLSLFLPLSLILIDSVSSGKLVCSTAGGIDGCDFISAFMLVLVYAVWILVLTLIPFSLIGLVCAVIIRKLRGTVIGRSST